MNPRQLLLLVGTGAFLISCGDEQNFGLQDEGTILVAALTTGDDLDPNGYTFSLDNRSPESIGLQDTVFKSALEPGTYEVRLGGIAENCAPDAGTNPQTAVVVAGDTVSTVFNIACEVLQPPGGGGP
jgi:hypothetical protein